MFLLQSHASSKERGKRSGILSSNAIIPRIVYYFVDRRQKGG